jgi:hypothetical protein
MTWQERELSLRPSSNGGQTFVSQTIDHNGLVVIYDTYDSRSYECLTLKESHSYECLIPS